MNRIIASIDTFFFHRISASGFGLMRMAWAATALTFFLMQWNDVVFHYSDAGLVRSEFTDLFRSAFRLTIFNWIRDPGPVFGVYLLMLASMAAMLLGIRTRLATILSVLLLFSFHERNLLPLGGGDTVLRCTGFLLMLAPEIRAFSVDRLLQQWQHWNTQGTLLPPLTMSIWPWRLLLWQFLIIYITSAMDKLNGDMWLTGTAVISALHHPHFARWPLWLMDTLAPFSASIGYATLLWEGLWILLLLPQRPLARVLHIGPHVLRRALLMGGVLFHGSIFLLMDVGSFSPAMMAGYLGLLLDEDFSDARAWLNRRYAGRKTPWRIAVLYDGICRICRRSMFALLMLDVLHRLQPVDFRNAKLRKAVAPTLPLSALDRALHIRIPPFGAQRSVQYVQGFDAFRILCWHLPPLWPLLPLLFLPGIPPLGRAVYARIAASRNRCANGACRHVSQR